LNCRETLLSSKLGGNELSAEKDPMVSSARIMLPSSEILPLDRPHVTPLLCLALRKAGL
jgi:hypothetical protein